MGQSSPGEAAALACSFMCAGFLVARKSAVSPVSGIERAWAARSRAPEQPGLLHRRRDSTVGSPSPTLPRRRELGAVSRKAAWQSATSYWTVAVSSPMSRPVVALVPPHLTLYGIFAPFA